MVSVENRRIKTNHRWAIVIGTGMALSPIHNEWLTNLVTDSNVVGFFLPSFGTALWFMGSLLFVLYRWSDLDWGSKKIWIPMLVIVASIGISGFIYNSSWNDRISPLFMGCSLFTVYLAARTLGVSIFRAFIPVVIVDTVVIVVCGIANIGVPTGGLITNYCASAGLLVFGSIVNQGRWQWLLILTALVGLFFIGALEAVFIVGVVGMVVIIRRDFDRKLCVAIGILATLIVLWISLGHLIPLYRGNHNVLFMLMMLKGELVVDDFTVKLLTTGRWDVINYALHHISIIGHGYSLGIVEGGTVHNLPLIIMHQVGPIAAVAWAFVTVYCLIKTKWKYAWVAMIAMCVFDHYIWTQFTPVWWALSGVSLTSGINDDRIFRK